MDLSNHAVNINWEINTGPKCVFGKIEITGNQYVNLDPIREQLAFKESDLYQKILLDKSQQQIYGLGAY